MKKFIIGTAAVLVLCGGGLAYLALEDAVQRELAVRALMKPEAEADAGATEADAAADDDAGAEDAAPPRWNVTFGDAPTAAWQEVATHQTDGKDGHLFGRLGSEIVLIITVMEPETDDPATELIEKTWNGIQREGYEVLPIEMISYDDHAWVGYRFGKGATGERSTGMAYASIDTTVRGAKLLVVAVWPDAESEVCTAWFHDVLRNVKVERQE